MTKKKIIQLLLPLIIASSISANNNTFTADSIRAVNAYNSGIKFFRNSNYQTAIDSFNISANIREKLYSKKSYEYGIIQNALGISYRNLGNLNRAADHFLAA